MTPVETNCAAIWYSALSSEIGKLIYTNNAARARQALYTTRKLLGDVELSRLQIRTSPNDPDHELWILHAVSPTVNLAEPREEQ